MYAGKTSLVSTRISSTLQAFALYQTEYPPTEGFIGNYGSLYRPWETWNKLLIGLIGHVMSYRYIKNIMITVFHHNKELIDLTL